MFLFSSRGFGFSFLAMVSVCALLTGTVSAQQITGEISGTVTDASDARVPNAKVVIRNTDTNQVARTLKTNGQGIYDAPLLQVGHYSVTVSAPGFKAQTVNDVEVDVSSSLKADLKLEIGDASETVVVASVDNQAPVVEDGALATVVTSKEIKDLALNTRNFEQIVQLQPGVVYGGSTDQVYTGLVDPSGTTNNTAISINGLRGDQNAWLIDGADVLAHNTGTQVVIHPSPDAIGQLKTLRNSYGAQYGGGGNAQIETITKSGTSSLNGEFHVLARNAIFNANDYFAKQTGAPKPDDQEYTGGFTLGGPVAIPHLLKAEWLNTFFFYGLEIKRDQVQKVQTNSDIPTPAQLQGTFTDAECQYPTTTSTTCKPTLQLTDIDPVAAEYIKDVFSHIGTPNNPNDPQGLIQAKIGTHDESEQIIRLDHAFTRRLSMFFRYIHDPVNYATPNGYGSGGGYPGVTNSVIDTTGDAYMLHATYALTGTTVIDGFVSYEPFGLTATPVGALATANSPDVNVTLPFPVTLSRLPTIIFQGGTDNYGTTGPVSDQNENYQASFNVFHSIGRHNVSFGGNLEQYREVVNSGGLNAGLYNFETSGEKPCNKAGAPSPCTNPTAFEQSVSHFLQGRASYFEQSNVDATSNAVVNIAEGYVQDDWKVLSHLTLNVGFRYSWFQQPHEVNHHLGSFDPSTYTQAAAPAVDINGNLCTTAPCAGGVVPNPNANVLDGFIIGGVNSPFGEAVSQQSTGGYGPRLGFAFDVFGDGNTALRGGYGIFYSESQLNLVHNSVFNNPAYVKNVTYNSPTSLANPAGTTASSTALLPNTAYGLAQNWHTPYTEGYSLGIQQKFPMKILSEMTYSGNVSRHLIGQIDLNQPQPGQFITAGLYGGSTTGGIYSPTVVTNTNTPVLNLIRPYLGYGASIEESPEFNANYNALQVTVQKRFGTSSTLNFYYTWANALTNSTGTTGNAPMNTYNPGAEYGPTSYNRRNTFGSHFIYRVPFFNKQTGFEGHLLGGWQFAGIVQIVSGLPLTITTGNVDPAGQGIRAPNAPEINRPDVLVQNPNQDAPHNIHSTIPGLTGTGYWFNPNDFENVPAPTCPSNQIQLCVAQARPGNARPGSVVGPGYQVWNLDLIKDTKTSEHTTLQFRVEAFNVWNHTNWQSIATKLQVGGFGQIAGDRDPRQMQLGARFTF